jgi:4-amino-4-deoxy-L-arabinose transferase-like glycosyltransferase
LQIADRRGFGVRIFDDGLTRPRAEAGARLLPFVIVCAAIALRVVPLLARYPLHRDEALYGAWARLVASGVDPLLLTAWVDKPPLVIYLLAASLRIFGPSEVALRLPGMIASVACVAITYGLAWQAFGRRVALLAAILCAFSPFAILFAPTAFTDPWLTVWLLASAWAAQAGKPFWAGILLGLAVASKQQGVLAAPLVVGLMAVQTAQETGSTTMPGSLHAFLTRRCMPALAGFLVVFLPLTYWDSLRWAKRPSFWGRGLDTYGGLRLARPHEWLGRLAAWAQQASYLYGKQPVTGVFLALSLLPGILALRQCRARPQRALLAEGPQRVDLLLLAYAAGYLALHVLATFQPWDRYLLPLLPLIAILAARGLVAIWNRLERLPRKAVAQLSLGLSLACLLIWAGWTGVSGRLPVGSDHGAFDSLDRVVEFVRSRPSGALVYHHSLGWYFDFYLFDAPQQRPWWENSWKLADLASRTANAQAGREQWLVLTEGEDPTEEGIREALASWGLALREEQLIYRHDRTRAFSIFQIIATRGRAIP